MKDRKTKEKKHESTIGKIIYGFLLFMPLLAIGVTCLVNTFNKEVTQETQDVEVTYKYQTNEVNSVDDLIEGNIYHYKNNNVANSRFGLQMYDLYNYQLTSSTLDTLQFSTIETIITKQDDWYFSLIILSDYQLNLYNQNGTYKGGLGYIDATNKATLLTVEFDFVYKPVTNYLSENINLISKCENIPIDNIEITTHESNANDVFYYAVDKVQQSPLFNWAENSIIYTGMNNFTNSLSITTPFIPLLLTYWLIISVVYFLYDIVLIILVVLHRKIHYLEESI